MTVDKAVKKYFAELPIERREMVNALHAIVIDIYPKAQVDMKYKMPTYHIGDAWVAIANQKHHVSLYTCSSSHIAQFKQKHPEIKTGKGCINFRVRDSLPLQHIRAVIKHAIEQPKG